jgi:N-acetylglutamate synthase-like GNAT family acetyltransferase
MQTSFHISTDNFFLNIDFIHQYIHSSYWGKERTLEQTISTVENSFCFGMYTASKQQIGFARVVTDWTFFGNIMDVFIDQEYQGMGLGKYLIEFMMNHKSIKSLQTITLKTKDAHSLYEKYGFKKVGESSLYMVFDTQILDK